MDIWNMGYGICRVNRLFVLQVGLVLQYTKSLFTLGIWIWEMGMGMNGSSFTGKTQTATATAQLSQADLS